MKGGMKMPRLDGGEFELAFKVLVSPHAAGKIIGRGGAEIAALRQNLHVGCHIHGPETPYPGTSLQVAVLFGSRASVDMSFEGLIAKICEAEAGSLQQGAQLTVHVVLTNNAVSAVIGTKGATIASLRQQASCGFSADKDLFQGEQVVRVTGQPERLPGALSLLTPFVERSGDSLQFAMKDYPPAAAGGGCWDGGWTGAPPASQKGMGKRMMMPVMQAGPQWALPSTQAIAPGPATARRRLNSPGAWQFGGGKGRPGGKGEGGDGGGPAAALAAAARAATEELELALAAPGELDDGTGEAAAAAPEEHVFGPDDPRVLSAPSTIAFPIPKDAIGRVLGRGGESSTAIRKATGASLKIEPGANEGTVMLSGTLAAVQQAHCMVVARVLAKV